MLMKVAVMLLVQYSLAATNHVLTSVSSLAGIMNCAQGSGKFGIGVFLAKLTEFSWSKWQACMP